MKLSHKDGNSYMTNTKTTKKSTPIQNVIKFPKKNTRIVMKTNLNVANSQTNPLQIAMPNAKW